MLLQGDFEMGAKLILGRADVAVFWGLGWEVVCKLFLKEESGKNYSICNDLPVCESKIQQESYFEDIKKDK